MRDGQWVAIGPGSTLFIPADVEHQIENTGSEPLLIICLVPPKAPEL